MTTLTGGPAQGQTMLLRRAPLFLRLTHDGAKWDHLDQLEDTPRPEETVHVYRRIGQPTNCHIKHQNSAASGFYKMATYTYVDDQPDPATVTDTNKWRAWCQANM